MEHSKPTPSAPSAFKAVPARLSGSSSLFWSGRGESNAGILLPKQATCHWPTPRVTGCGRQESNRCLPAYETGVLPLHHLRIVMAPQVRIERTTTRLTAARSASLSYRGIERHSAGGCWANRTATGAGRRFNRHANEVVVGALGVEPRPGTLKGAALSLRHTPVAVPPWPRGASPDALAVRTGLAFSRWHHEGVSRCQPWFSFHVLLLSLRLDAGSAAARGRTRPRRLAPR